ncbi:MAG: hypothetical protein ACFFD5_16055 [Candidatus Thorarchaeota archaeon]
MEKVIQEFAPEIRDIYNVREDESEEQQIKTGQLHENRILGIMLKYYLEGKRKVATRDVELEYKKYFKEIARSTISTYLNMLKKESTLSKERDGRIVYYKLYDNPPEQLNPFWFTRIFCIDPAYFNRAIYFASLYSIADLIVQKKVESSDKKGLVEYFKYVIGLTILYILKNRVDKCSLCQFSKHESYNQMIETLVSAIKERADVLPEELLNPVIKKYAEIPTFGGQALITEESEIDLIENILKQAKTYKKDIDFQKMVFNRRLEAKILQKINLETKDLESKEEKVID